jgi:hypothetical protein
MEPELLERFVGRPCGIHLELLLSQEFSQCVPDRLFVIDYQDGDDSRMSGQPDSPGEAKAKLGIGCDER